MKFYLRVKIEWGELPTSPKGIVYTPIVIQIFFSYLAKIEYNCCSLNFRQWTNSPFSLLFSEDRIHLNFVRKFIRENVLLKTTIFIVNFLYTFLKHCNMTIVFRMFCYSLYSICFPLIFKKYQICLFWTALLKKKTFCSILFTKLDIGCKLIWFPKDSISFDVWSVFLKLFYTESYDAWS